jgi:hypothetical protein
MQSVEVKTNKAPFYDEILATAQRRTKNMKICNCTIWTQVLWKGNQFLVHYCYNCSWLIFLFLIIQSD